MKAMTALVYRQYDQSALDAQYDQRTLVPDVSDYLRRWREDSERVRTRYDRVPDLCYGPGPRERIDLFPAACRGSPLVLFFHGGAWRRLSKDEFHYPAPGFLERGIAYAAAGFDLVPSVPLAKQVDQARRALAWMHANAKRYGVDEQRIFVLGNSSGGHLAGMLMCAAGDGERSPARGGLLVSGIYDLEPVRLSSRNEYLNLDRRAARDLSPIQRIPSACRPLIVAWGGRELAEFQRQSGAFAETWAKRGGVVEEVIMAQHNHFDMTSELGDPRSPLLRPFITMVRATP